MKWRRGVSLAGIYTLKNIDIYVDSKKYKVKYKADRPIYQDVFISVLEITNHAGVVIESPSIDIFVDKINVGLTRYPTFFDHVDRKLLETVVSHIIYNERQPPIRLEGRKRY